MKKKPEKFCIFFKENFFSASKYGNNQPVHFFLCFLFYLFIFFYNNALKTQQNLKEGM